MMVNGRRENEATPGLYNVELMCDDINRATVFVTIVPTADIFRPLTSFVTLRH
jgi:hypothetical protein